MLWISLWILEDEDVDKQSYGIEINKRMKKREGKKLKVEKNKGY